MLNNILMKKGIIHLVPVIVAAGVLTLGIIGLVATQRGQELESGNVLSSSNQNKDQGQNKKEETKENNSQGEKINPERYSEDFLN